MKKRLIISISLVFIIICFIFTAAGCFSSNLSDKNSGETSGQISETTLSDINKTSKNSQENKNTSAAETSIKSTETSQAPETTASATEYNAKEKYLTIADVEKVSGETGIKLVDYDPSIGAGGDLNFAKSDGTMFLMAQVQPKSLWDEWKKQKDYFDASLSGIGDQAYNGPKGMGMHYIVFFTKGDQAFSVSSFFNVEDGTTYLSEDQLIELAKIMASR